MKIYQVKAKDTEIKLYPLCLDNISEDFMVDNKKLDEMNICMFLFNTIVYNTIDYNAIDVSNIVYSQIFNEKTLYKIMFRLIKKVFVLLLCFRESLATKYISLNHEPI